MNLLLKEEAQKPGFENMVGRSPVMRKIYRQIRQAAQSDIPVLITGETGTGKDLVAGAIHQLSSRSGKPFMPIHLGSLPQELVSGELFGYEKGAFTGAWKSYRGGFARICIIVWMSSPSICRQSGNGTGMFRCWWIITLNRSTRLIRRRFSGYRRGASIFWNRTIGPAMSGR